MDSLVPVATNAVNAVNKAANSAYAGMNKAVNSVIPSMNFSRNTSFGAVNSSPSMFSGESVAGWVTPMYWFVGFLLLFLVLLGFFYRPFMDSLQNITDSISKALTGKGNPPPPASPPHDVPTAPPQSPQDDATTPPSGMDAVVEKMLPPAKEVFNVSKNDFSYYDAAPLCKALGAELATYDQVKASWQKGADWCNYGWVKGQMAVYPTQKSTYQELQQGPEDQQGACGKPGINGGYFDNPELKFGVSCYGQKPAQSQHDATAVTSGATRPLTSSGIEFESKVQAFKRESDNLGLLPFNKDKWQS